MRACAECRPYKRRGWSQAPSSSSVPCLPYSSPAISRNPHPRSAEGEYRELLVYKQGHLCQTATVSCVCRTTCVCHHMSMSHALATTPPPQPLGDDSDDEQEGGGESSVWLGAVFFSWVSECFLLCEQNHLSPCAAQDQTRFSEIYPHHAASPAWPSRYRLR